MKVAIQPIEKYTSTSLIGTLGGLNALMSLAQHLTNSDCDCHIRIVLPPGLSPKSTIWINFTTSLLSTLKFRQNQAPISMVTKWEPHHCGKEGIRMSWEVSQESIHDWENRSSEIQGQSPGSQRNQPLGGRMGPSMKVEGPGKPEQREACLPLPRRGWSHYRFTFWVHVHSKLRITWFPEKQGLQGKMCSPC